MRDIAEEHGVFTSYANLVGTEGGKRFAGSSLHRGAAGDVRVRAPVWEEHLIVGHRRSRRSGARARRLAAAGRPPRGAAARARTAASGARAGAGAAARTTAPSRPRPTSCARPAASRPASSPCRRSCTPAPAARRQRRMTSASRACALREQGGPPPLDARRAPMTEQWLIGFLREEFARRGYTSALVGLVRRRRLGGDRVPRRPCARRGERDRRAHALSHVERRVARRMRSW